LSEVSASQALFDDINGRAGARPSCGNFVHSPRVKMKEENSALAGEMSGQLFFGRPLVFGLRSTTPSTPAAPHRAAHAFPRKTLRRLFSFDTLPCCPTNAR